MNWGTHFITNIILTNGFAISSSRLLLFCNLHHMHHHLFVESFVTGAGDNTEQGSYRPGKVCVSTVVTECWT